MKAAIFVVLCAVAGTAYSRPGGLGEIKKADADIKKAVNAISSALAFQTKSAANTKFEPIEYGVQVVAGRNYFVKIRSGPARPGSPFILARIYQSLDGKYTLDGVKNIKDSDQVEYFDSNMGHETTSGLLIKAGGLGAVKPADAEAKKAVNAVSSKLASQLKSAANTKFEPIEYATQTVAGTNYFVKIRSGPAQPGSPFILARIYQSLDGKYSLDGIKNIKDSDQVEYFDSNVGNQEPTFAIVGGVGAVKPADADVKKAVNAVSSALAAQEKSNANTKFEPIEYATQTVSGTNYFVKIRRGPARPGSPFVLARINQSLDGKYKLEGYKRIKDSDQVEYIEANDFPTRCRAIFC